MGKVMDVKQMFLEARGCILPLVQPAFKGTSSASPRNIIGAHLALSNTDIAWVTVEPTRCGSNEFSTSD